MMYIMSRMVGNWLTQRERERVNRNRTESKTDAEKEKTIKESDPYLSASKWQLKIPD